VQHPHRTQVPKRPLNKRERAWVGEILQQHPLWLDVDVSETWIVAECGCGECRTVYLDSDIPQNPLLKETRGYIGRIEIRTINDFGITVTLDQRDGKLSELYINYVDLSDDGRRPFPQDWEESAHLVQAM
jgi:hypothetical protein